ncbi:MAG: TonB-dependent receptor [Gammaproteobacteria bacterium]|nr:TonB-dependent receptor [Gammaproteobacteria bacterium]
MAIAVSLVLTPACVLAEEAVSKLDEIVVEEEAATPTRTHYTSPSTVITEIDVESINATSVEDFVKYEPSLVMRRRYIGDSNGVVGIRGSNMFQTARTLVYADGMPLHYLLETRWSGAPRWGLVAGDETESVEVIYGPFSAEYSGNAMGGVVNIDTKLPEKREFHLEGGAFLQDFSHMGADDTYFGHREFLSYGDKFGDLSLYLFHNHLENEGQPQTFRSSTISDTRGGETVVTGGIRDVNSVGDEVIYYGDSGTADTISDLTKLKLGYDFGDWSSQLTLAYEDRDWKTRPTSYLVDENGDTVWGGSAVFEGDRIRIGSWSGNPFAVSDQTRQSLLVGGGIEGPMGNSGWILDADFSVFDIIKDETFSSDLNPEDPDYTTAGSVEEYDDTGWQTVDLQARTDRFLNRSDMQLVVGYHYDHYSLRIDEYESDNYLSGEKTTPDESSGGETRTHALFAQLGWHFDPQWDLTLGGRYEQWETIDGFLYDYAKDDLKDFDDRKETAFSPKFSVGYAPDQNWQIRYSKAKAYRFPIVEELFKHNDSVFGSTIADAELEPEVGIHDNLMFERQISRGFVRLNLFHEVVEDAIWNQTDYTTNITTFLPVDEVTTSGIELVLEQDNLLDSNTDIRFNVAYTDSEITKNSADPSTEGNVFPRIPKWRANLLATWHMTAKWDSSVGVRYASNSYGRLDNEDKAEEVYGAQDKYLFVDLKANYEIAENAKLAFGIDNVTDDEAFVAHPWPQRTYYLQGSIDF